MYAEIFDYENIVEAAIARFLTDNGIPASTSVTPPELQKVRPRAEVEFVLGPGLLKWASPQALPGPLAHTKVETAWKATLTTAVLTTADEPGRLVLSDYRSKIRMLYLDLASRVNGIYLVLHRIALVKETGNTRTIIPQEDREVLRMTHELDFSIHSAAWMTLTEFAPVPAASDSPAAISGAQWITSVLGFTPAQESGQIKVYDTDPNDEGVTPDNQSLPAVAYSKTGITGMFGWNTDTHQWV